MVLSVSAKCFVRIPSTLIHATAVQVCIKPTPWCCGLWRPRSFPVIVLDLENKERLQVSEGEWVVSCGRTLFCSINLLIAHGTGSFVVKLKLGDETLLKIPASRDYVQYAMLAEGEHPIEVSFTSGPVITRVRYSDILRPRQDSEEDSVNRSHSHSPSTASGESECDRFYDCPDTLADASDVEISASEGDSGYEAEDEHSESESVSSSSP